MTMDRLATILPNVLRKRGFEAQGIAHLRMSHAKRWLERELAAFPDLALSLKVEGGVLLVQTSDAAALAACSERSHELLAYVQKEAPGPGLESVRVFRA